MLPTAVWCRIGFRPSVQTCIVVSVSFGFSRSIARAPTPAATAPTVSRFAVQAAIAAFSAGVPRSTSISLRTVVVNADSIR